MSVVDVPERAVLPLDEHSSVEQDDGEEARLAQAESEFLDGRRAFVERIVEGEDRHGANPGTRPRGRSDDRVHHDRRRCRRPRRNR